jgi:hypothetical protein
MESNALQSKRAIVAAPLPGALISLALSFLAALIVILVADLALGYFVEKLPAFLARSMILLR